MNIRNVIKSSFGGNVKIYDADAEPVGYRSLSNIVVQLQTRTIIQITLGRAKLDPYNLWTNQALQPVEEFTWNINENYRLNSIFITDNIATRATVEGRLIKIKVNHDGIITPTQHSICLSFSIYNSTTGKIIYKLSQFYARLVKYELRLVPILSEVSRVENHDFFTFEVRSRRNHTRTRKCVTGVVTIETAP